MPAERLSGVRNLLQERHGLPEELLQDIAVVEALATKAGE
jgi:hypothetical protein